jgi:hypothetical protein
MGLETGRGPLTGSGHGRYSFLVKEGNLTIEPITIQGLQIHNATQR